MAKASYAWSIKATPNIMCMYARVPVYIHMHIYTFCLSVFVFVHLTWAGTEISTIYGFGPDLLHTYTKKFQDCQSPKKKKKNLQIN